MKLPKDFDIRSGETRVTGIGHSMGGMSLLAYLLQCGSAKRPHNLHNVILLSPAGYHDHLSWLHRTVITYFSNPVFTYVLKKESPFPIFYRSWSATHSIIARIGQVCKRLPALGQLINYAWMLLTGGYNQETFPFAFIEFTAYVRATFNIVEAIYILI